MKAIITTVLSSECEEAAWKINCAMPKHKCAFVTIPKPFFVLNSALNIKKLFESEQLSEEAKACVETRVAGNNSLPGKNFIKKMTKSDGNTAHALTRSIVGYGYSTTTPPPALAQPLTLIPVKDSPLARSVAWGVGRRASPQENKIFNNLSNKT